MTKSAPKRRHKFTGTGLTTAPSTSQRPLNFTGGNKAGIAQDARTASTTSPSLKTTSLPEYKSVAVNAKGFCISLKLAAENSSASNLKTCSPLANPPRLIPTPSKRKTCQSLNSNAHSFNLLRLPEA